MGAPLDQFLFILFRGPLRSASLLTIRGPLRSSVCILLQHVYGALSNQFLVYYIRHNRGPSDQLYRLLYGSPQINFFTYYMGPPRLVSVLTIWGPLRSVFVDTTCIWGPLRSVSSLTIGGPLRSAYLLTIWGPPYGSFFAYYVGPPDQFLRLLYGPPEISFLAY